MNFQALFSYLKPFMYYKMEQLLWKDVVYTHTHTYKYICIYTQNIIQYTHIEYYSTLIKNDIMPFAATWMDLEMIILSEISQTEMGKYHMMSLICRV